MRSPARLDTALAVKLISATSNLGLVFAGWDFKVSSEDGRVWCLEANPMPGYDGYDRRLGGAVTASLLKCLQDASYAQSIHKIHDN